MCLIVLEKTKEGGYLRVDLQLRDVINKIQPMTHVCII